MAHICNLQYICKLFYINIHITYLCKNLIYNQNSVQVKSEIQVYIIFNFCISFYNEQIVQLENVGEL